jgi:hypothetical protein
MEHSNKIILSLLVFASFAQCNSRYNNLFGSSLLNSAISTQLHTVHQCTCHLIFCRVWWNCSAAALLWDIHSPWHIPCHLHQAVCYPIYRHPVRAICTVISLHTGLHTVWCSSSAPLYHLLWNIHTEANCISVSHYVSILHLQNKQAFRSKGFWWWCMTLRIIGFLDFPIITNSKY